MKLFKNKIIYFIKENIVSTEEVLITGILPLVNNEYIKQKYIYEVIEKFHKKNNQFILNENVLILYVDPSLNLCLKNGISLVYFVNNINLLLKKNIKFIISISAIDQQNHQELLKNSRQLFSNEAMIKKLSIKKTLQELIDELELYDI